jgi:tetratricopeptide (TPR) repeat protein
MSGVFRIHRSAAVIVALVAVIATAVARESEAAPFQHRSERSDPFADCRRQLAAAPDDYDSSFCFFTVTYQRQIWEDGIRAFDALMRQQPDNHWLPLAFGHVHRNRLPHPDVDAAEALYRRAAEGFARRHHVEGEILARSNLRDMLVPLGRVSEATQEVARVKALGASTPDPVLRSRAWMLEATHVMDTGGDLGLAYRVLKQTQAAIAAGGPYRLRRTCLTALGQVSFRMGRLDEALAAFRELEVLAGAEGDIETQANAKYNLLNTEQRRADFLPSSDARAHLLRLARETLSTGVAAGHRVVMEKTHRSLAALLANDPTTRREALDHVESCVALATAARQPQDEALCSGIAAMLLYDKNPDAALAAQQRAAVATDRANNPVADGVNAHQHMRFSWLSRPRSEAIRESFRALDAIETLRSLQEAPDSAAAFFSSWTLDYSWFSGRLLQDERDQDLESAFSVTERMRARALLEMRDRARTTQDETNPAVTERRRVLRDIASTQRTLMGPGASADERQTQLRRLEQLEAQEQEAQRQIALASSAPRKATFATLAAVQHALSEDEALLSYQVGIWTTYEGEFGGGSWLVVATRDRRRAYRIPDRVHFAPLVPVFTGLLARGDGLEIPAAVRLYRDVFSTALTDLPRRITRLILVPDGPLQHLPFDALRAEAGRPPLADQYDLVLAPSATLWLGWRANPPAASKQRALALADPDVIASVNRDAGDRGAFLTETVALGRLPHARTETRSMARRVSGVDRLVGADASERVIKTRDLRQYDIVHFAAHAIADESFPERSAVFLAPGDESEDGLLQAREIADLNLADRIVVLSACRTAAGIDLSGEGVLSLARAFFEAGARTVVGTRWPIRDADAAWLFDVFYAELGRGVSVSQALTRTKGRAIAAGLRADAWAGLVLLGDGTVRPFPDNRRLPERSPWIVIAASVALAALIAARRAWRVR